MNISIELSILIGTLLLVFSIVLSKAGYRFGVPTLLVFLIAGMLFGTDGAGIEFDNVHSAQTMGMIALCIILFSGGMDTRMADIRPVLGPGLMLSTAGVLLTTLLTGVFAFWLSGWEHRSGIGFTLLTSLLLAATMSSTDSASVFSILRSKRQGLTQNLRPLLELESGSNDPMAYVLTVLLVGVLSHDAGEAGVWQSILTFVVQMAVGAVSGYLIGRLAVWTINRINLANHSLYSVLLAFIFFAFAFTDLIRGNGYLAVYLAGLVVGNHKLVQKRSLTVFFDGFTWLVQIVMFLTLGLFVNGDELIRPEVLLLGLVVGAFMIFVARPLTVFLCLAPFRRFSTRARIYVSWVGLRGAVPIIFATYPLVAGVEHAELLFNVVFLATIVSLVVQGTTVSGMANFLGLAFEEKAPAFGVDMSDDMKSALTEIEVNECVLENGRTLREIALPEHTLVMMICRDGEYFVPQGKTQLHLGDKLLVISDRGEELENTYKDMGVDEVMKL